MTLIASFVNEKYAIQVSDLKISRGVETVSSHSPKMTFVEKQMAFSFTGVADINRVNSADWFAKTWHSLNCSHFNTACEDIARIGTETFSKIKHYREEDKRIAFAGCGFILLKNRNILPSSVLIHNCLDGNHVFKPKPDKEFKVEYLTLTPPNNVLFGFSGRALSPGFRKKIMMPIFRFMKRSWNPQIVIEYLVDGLRKAASHYPETIGKNCLVSYIPVETALEEHDDLLFGSKFKDFKKPCFLFYPELKEDPRIIAPNVVNKRSIVIQKDWLSLEKKQDL